MSLGDCIIENFEERNSNIQSVFEIKIENVPCKDLHNN